MQGATMRLLMTILCAMWAATAHANVASYVEGQQAGYASVQAAITYTGLGSVTGGAKTSYLDAQGVIGFFIHVTGTTPVRVMFSETTITASPSDQYTAMYTISQNNYAVVSS